MPLKSYKICSKIFEHGNDPPPLLKDVQKNCGFGDGGHPLWNREISANLSVRNVEIKLDKYIVKIIKILVTSI